MSQDNAKREAAIEQVAVSFCENGYGVNPIVYRDTLKVGLAIAFLTAANVDAKAKVGAHLNWCVIGTKTCEDNTKIREGVDQLASSLEQQLKM